MNHAPSVDISFEIRVAPQARAAYEAIYSSDGIRQIDSFYRWILRVLGPQPGRRLLDVACGEGTLPNFARQLCGLDAYGSDISVVALQTGRAEGEAGFCASSGEELPFANGSFDYVTCLGSLEHFHDMAAGVREMARVLRPDGLALILVPNTYSLFNNIYTALKTGMSAIDNQPLQRYAARGEWAMLIEANGLRIERTHKYEYPPPDSLSDLRWYIRHWRPMVRMAVAPLIPLNLAASFVYLCRPATGAA